MGEFRLTLAKKGVESRARDRVRFPLLQIGIQQREFAVYRGVIPVYPVTSSGNLERNASRRHDVQNLFGEPLLREAGADGAGDFPVVLRPLNHLGHGGPDVADIPGRNAPPAGVVLPNVAGQLRSVVHHQQDIRNTLSRKDLLSQQAGSPASLQPVHGTETSSAHRSVHAMLV